MRQRSILIFAERTDKMRKKLGILKKTKKPKQNTNLFILFQDGKSAVHLNATAGANEEALNRGFKIPIEIAPRDQSVACNITTKSATTTAATTTASTGVTSGLAQGRGRTEITKTTGERVARYLYEVGGKESYIFDVHYHCITKVDQQDANALSTFHA